MLSITCWLVLKLGMPFSRRPLVTVVTKSCLDSVFRQLISEGPTTPSWFGPWQRSHAAARQVRKPCIVSESTLVPSTTLYSGAAAAVLDWAYTMLLDTSRMDRAAFEKFMGETSGL